MGKRLADRYKQGNKEPKDQVSKVIKESEEHEAIETKTDLQVELEALKAKYAPFKNNTTIAVQEDIAQLLNYANVEFKMTQKELASIAILRLLEELKEKSQLLQTFMK